MAGSYNGEFIMTSKIITNKVIFTNDIEQPVWDGYVRLKPQDLPKLSDMFYESQLVNIYAPSILNQIPQDKISEIIPNMINKLAKNGHITIGGVEAYLLSKQVTKRNINLIELNKLLFSTSFTSLVDIREIVDMIKKLNINILHINIDESECRFTIQGIKK